MKAELLINKEALKKATERLEGIPNGIETALRLSFNRALSEGRTAGTREVTKAYTVKAKNVRPTFAMHKATKSDLNAELLSTGKRLSLDTFTHRPQADTTGAKRKEVRVSIRKGSLKPVNQGFVHRAMIFQRLGKTRLPVQKQFGPAVPAMLDHEAVSDVVVETLGKSVDKRLAHETKRLLDQP